MANNGWHDPDAWKQNIPEFREPPSMPVFKDPSEPEVLTESQMDGLRQISNQLDKSGHSRLRGRLN